MPETTWRANHTSSGVRAVGGKLKLTADRLSFEPHGFDRALAGKDWTTDLRAIRSVGKEGRNLNPLSGGMRTRLRIETVGGEAALFVVNKLDRVIEEIESAAAAAGGAAGARQS